MYNINNDINRLFHLKTQWNISQGIEVTKKKKLYNIRVSEDLYKMFEVIFP